MSTDEGATNPGPNIRAAASVMRATHEETSALFSLVDKLMDERGFHHTHISSQGWVGLRQNGAQIGQPDNWMATSLHRAYVLRPMPTHVVVIVEVQLLPTSYSEPILSILALRMSAPIAEKELWDKWKWETADDVFRQGVFGEISLMPKEISGAHFHDQLTVESARPRPSVV